METVEFVKRDGGYYGIEGPVLSTITSKILKECLALKAGECVAIETWTHGLEIAREFAYQAKKMGAHPLLLYEDEENFWRGANEISPSKLGKVGRHEWSVLKESDAYVFIPGPENEGKLEEVGEKVEDALFSYNQEWYSRAGKAGIRGVRFGLGYVTKRKAEKRGIDFNQWVREEVKALDIDYAGLDATGRKLARALQRGKIVTISHPNGTDLKFKLEHTTYPILNTGVMKKKFDPSKDYKYGVLTDVPAGGISAVPRGDSASGTIKFNLTTQTQSGPVQDLFLSFEGKGGKISEYSGQGEAFEKSFRAKYDADKKPDKGRAALFSLGLNPKQRTGFGFDDSAEGVVLFGVGHFGYGDKNKTDFRFYGMLEGSTVSIDDNTVAREGKITLR